VDKKPGNAPVFALHAALRETGSENPDASVVSRRQFVATVCGAVPGVSQAAAGMLYSAFDPYQYDRLRYGAVTAALIAAIRPGANDMLGNTGAGAHRGPTSGARTVLRLVAELVDSDGDGLSGPEIEAVLLTCSSTESDEDVADALADDCFPDALRAGVLGAEVRVARDSFLARCTAHPTLLDEFQAQLSAFRAAVGIELDALLGLGPAPWRKG
jgi:hypothetical protein